MRAMQSSMSCTACTHRLMQDLARERAVVVARPHALLHGRDHLEGFVYNVALGLFCLSQEVSPPLLDVLVALVDGGVL